MGYADNPFAPVTKDEKMVMHHLKTVLNRLSPETTQSIIRDISGKEVNGLTEWESERETSKDTPDTVYLLGLSERPPVIHELQKKEDGGPVDLYSETEEVGIAIEGKTKGSLYENQLSQYKTALGADSFSTVSWSELYRSLSGHQENMQRYPAELVGEFLNYLKILNLHKPHQLAECRWGGGSEGGTKQIRVEQSDELRVIWKVEADEGGGKQDIRRLPWGTFCSLFNDIEDRHGSDLIQRVFVDAEPFHEQPEITGDTTLGQTDPVRQYKQNNRLRLNYHADEQALKLRVVRPSERGSLGSPASPGEGFCWYTGPSELQDILGSRPERPGFEPEFRNALFLRRDKDSVREYLW